MEAEDYEEKALFDFTHGQELDLIKTIVAFSNTGGGRIKIEKVLCDASRLDSARLDDLVNRHVSPRLGGIRSRKNTDGSCDIFVEKSQRGPHVFSKSQSFKNSSGQEKDAWRAGFLPVRHSSKTTAALGDDVHRMIAERTEKILSAVAGSITKLGKELVSDPSGLPVKITADPHSLELKVANFNQVYPYTAKTLGKRIKKSSIWTAKAVRKLELFDDPNYHQQILGYKQPVHRYSEACRSRLEIEISSNADFNPYS